MNLKSIISILTIASTLTVLTSVTEGFPSGINQQNQLKSRLASVNIDYASVIKLKGQASTIVIGNSGIVSATVSDGNNLVLTGKASGNTNIIVLDDNGNRVDEINVEVVESRSKKTTIYQGSKVETYHCGASCTPVLEIGNSAEYFKETESQLKSRNSFSEGSVGSEQTQ